MIECNFLTLRSEQLNMVKWCNKSFRIEDSKRLMLVSIFPGKERDIILVIKFVAATMKYLSFNSIGKFGNMVRGYLFFQF